MQFKEIETKYDAKDISLPAFTDAVNALQPKSWMMVSSYDDYFVNKDNDFIRYRHTDERGELTIKKKTNDKNNIDRLEVNVPTKGGQFQAIDKFVSLLGYTHNFGIYKTCKIAFLEKVVLVYYVVYDNEMKEQRRFVEIEANEEYTWASEADAWAEVQAYEKLLEPIGVSSRGRLKKSLFEMFKKA